MDMTASTVENEPSSASIRLVELARVSPTRAIFLRRARRTAAALQAPRQPPLYGRPQVLRNQYFIRSGGVGGAQSCCGGVLPPRKIKVDFRIKVDVSQCKHQKAERNGPKSLSSLKRYC